MARKSCEELAFDFEVGELKQSPCKTCDNWQMLPTCSADCEILSKIQMVIAGGVSCVKNYSPAEAFTIASERGNKIIYGEVG